jgi:hypothetical protein
VGTGGLTGLKGGKTGELVEILFPQRKTGSFLTDSCLNSSHGTLGRNFCNGFCRGFKPTKSLKLSLRELAELLGVMEEGNKGINLVRVNTKLSKITDKEQSDQVPQSFVDAMEKIAKGLNPLDSASMESSCVNDSNLLGLLSH